MQSSREGSAGIDPYPGVSSQLYFHLCLGVPNTTVFCLYALLRSPVPALALCSFSCFPSVWAACPYSAIVCSHPLSTSSLLGIASSCTPWKSSLDICQLCTSPMSLKAVSQGIPLTVELEICTLEAQSSNFPPYLTHIPQDCERHRCLIVQHRLPPSLADHPGISWIAYSYFQQMPGWWKPPSRTFCLHLLMYISPYWWRVVVEAEKGGNSHCSVCPNNCLKPRHSHCTACLILSCFFLTSSLKLCQWDTVVPEQSLLPLLRKSEFHLIPAYLLLHRPFHSQIPQILSFFLCEHYVPCSLRQFDKTAPTVPLWMPPASKTFPSMEQSTQALNISAQLTLPGRARLFSHLDMLGKAACQNLWFLGLF